ncbi:MAG: heme exporter protein CcmB [Legionellales bacterium]|nr:heme exporter protein CcmB [Legionellales bacterium]
MNYSNAFMIMLFRDLRIAFRQRAEIMLPVIFFVVIVSLFPLAISPDPAVLKNIGPGIIWVAALLSILLSLQNLFRSDFSDGSMEQILLSPFPGSLLFLAKILAQWCVTGLPLVLISPLLGLLLYLETHVICVLFISLLMGVPYLNMIGAIGVALTIGLKQAGALLSLLVLPLYVPVLIFGSNAVISAANDLPYNGQLLWLAALLVLATTLSPFVINFALRVSCSYR